MGAGKSKPKEPGQQRSMSLDGTIGPGPDSGHFHHLGPAQQTQTPNRSPAAGTCRREHRGQHQHAPTNTPELALFGGVDHTGTLTSPQRGPLSGRPSWGGGLTEEEEGLRVEYRQGALALGSQAGWVII